jgi:hypothetical protein
VSDPTVTHAAGTQPDLIGGSGAMLVQDPTHCLHCNGDLRHVWHSEWVFLNSNGSGAVGPPCSLGSTTSYRFCAPRVVAR